MKITPVKGTNDYLPGEAALRDYMQSKILAVYRGAGFERITTPIMEDIENLDKSDGGENLSLIFKILKRGDKLEEALAGGGELCDTGLRYDLTLPLTRYYANNRAKLPSPFKVIQLDRVYRAERPQKGRLREFVQCDIDIIGEPSYTAEVELILTTVKALRALSFEDFRVKLNDRSLLREIICGAGFADIDCDSVCISLDKLDKIGGEGVKAELTEKGFDASAVDKLGEIMAKTPFTLEDAAALCPDSPALENLRRIISTVETLSAALGQSFTPVYDLTLVRGQGYYTGTVFEVESPKFRGAIAGGGRYDNLIGKFTGESTPAVGFSIGFERIYSILTDIGFKSPELRKKCAVLYLPGDNESFINACAAAEKLRGDFDAGLFATPKKLGKLLAKLEEAGYDAYLAPGDELKFLGEKR